jgi:hypothetical protein
VSALELLTDVRLDALPGRIDYWCTVQNFVFIWECAVRIMTMHALEEYLPVGASDSVPSRESCYLSKQKYVQ